MDTWILRGAMLFFGTAVGLTIAGAVLNASTIRHTWVLGAMQYLVLAAVGLGISVAVGYGLKRIADLIRHLPGMWPVLLISGWPAGWIVITSIVVGAIGVTLPGAIAFIIGMAISFSVPALMIAEALKEEAPRQGPW
ncbi:MAG: hypothetical protein WD926_01730 [Patescibacteria group bacterium]